ncbi:MAG: hypothetical protein MUE46_04165 [Xanthomonadales bacterium]|nr:hypothetical protein [Xanthomonadales bacterium]
MLRRRYLGLVAVVVLAACAGGRRHGLELPLVSVQGISVDESGDRITLLVRHFGKRPTRLTGLRLEVLLLGETLALQQVTDLPLPPQAQEVLTLPLQLPQALRRDLLALAGDRGAELQIRGNLNFGMSPQPVRFDGRIAPVPGRPGQFR